MQTVPDAETVQPMLSNPAAPSLSVQDLWAFATGGSEVAARPSDPPPGVEGPRPAGVAEASQWMRRALDDPGQGQRLLFLVGGPGGGKSHVAAEIVGGLVRSDRQGNALAYRSYTYECPAGRELVLVNDATIPSDNAALVGTLAADIEALAGRHLVACVNRGVLVDELSREEGSSVGALVTAWLRTGAEGVDEATGVSLVAAGAPRDYLRQATLRGPGWDALVFAVFVDVCSLFEELPLVTDDGDQMVGNKYEVAEFAAGLDRQGTAAGQFLRVVAGSLDATPWSEEGPIGANLHSLGSTRVRDGVMSVLRAAEIHSAQRLSYRQLWGALARMVAGNLPEQINAEALEGWLAEREPGPASSARSRFNALRNLGSLRLHEALFGHEGAAETKHPLVGITRKVDPARDLRANAIESAWSLPLFEAFSAAAVGASPLAGILLAPDAPVLAEYVASFDYRLDAAFVAAMEDEPDVAWRTEATAWYGTYLTRLLGVATGHPAFVPDLRAWTKAWRLSNELPTDLARSLEALVAPRRDPDDPQSPSLVPLYTSRAMAMVGAPNQPTLAVSMPALSLGTRREGEDLFLRVMRGDEEVGEMVLDLALVREALVVGDGWLGLTDVTESTVPRLERFRAVNLMVAARKAEGLRLVTPQDMHAVRAPKED